ncbi:thioesterase II family protein [Kitasatospora brasiliensis]|uniref:thioesterase II family protein n=1 Tax=Kitasatospora brasiliensis TaxID=3058040 RepID=UPI00292EB165|nr:alpha/beta fold hydrolase [Kitasatospora sp. K002]
MLFRDWTRRPGAALTLLCLPPAGAGAHLFRGWAARLPAQIAVIGVELPGHGGRLAEAPVTDLTALIEGPLRSEVSGLLDRPLAVFGQSMGAHLGLELCHALARDGDWQPALLAVAAAPVIEDLPLPQDRELTDQEVIDFLRFTGGTSPDLMANDEYLALLVPVIRADLTLIAGRPANPDRPPLDCPVRAYGGASDPGVPVEDLESWRAQCTGDFHSRVFPGGHFFAQEQEAELLRELERELLSCLDPF